MAVVVVQVLYGREPGLVRTRRARLTYGVGSLLFSFVLY